VADVSYQVWQDVSCSMNLFATVLGLRVYKCVMIDWLNFRPCQPLKMHGYAKTIVTVVLVQFSVVAL